MGKEISRRLTVKSIWTELRVSAGTQGGVADEGRSKCIKGLKWDPMGDVWRVDGGDDIP